ncbi:MAG: hypothetical protein JWM50_249 [Microbacteriaceae bacterium]|jgi:uncharacterized damage-inducible protein DinB|nr:hypothetical protein [Microbacteriaceae bacterium]
MTTQNDLLRDAFGRIRGTAARTVDGLSAEQLEFRPGGTGNSIAWLVWHLARVQDDHIADAAGTQQAWTADGWSDRFALPFEAGETGYGMDPDQVASVRGITAEQLTGYLDAVHRRTLAFLDTDPDFDRVVDENWNPPVTLAVRLVSILSDDLQHAGQAGYVRGLLA